MEGTGPGEPEAGTDGSGIDAIGSARDSVLGGSGSCGVSETGGALGARCVVGVGKLTSDGAVSVLGLAVVAVAAVETAVDGLSGFGLAAVVLALVDTAVDGLFLFGFSSIDTILPIFFS